MIGIINNVDEDVHLFKWGKMSGSHPTYENLPFI